ncbi:MAG: HAMP domain-containing sensor histidine kinase [Candidatus Micrarchaeota archaeon]
MDKKGPQMIAKESDYGTPRVSGVVARARPSFNSFLDVAPILDGMMASLGAGFEVSLGGTHGVFTSTGFAKAAQSGNVHLIEASFAEFDATITIAASEDSDSIARMAKYALVGEVSTGLAHDFRNVLTVIMADLELVRTKSDMGEVPALLNEMDEAVQLGLGICGRFERMVTTQRERKSENLWGLVDSSVRLLRSPLRDMQGRGKHIAFQDAVSQDLWVDVVYRDLQAAMLNIMLNALRHGFRNRMEGTISLVGQKAGGRVFLHIANDGEPVPPEVGELLLQQPVPSMDSWGVGLYSASQSLRRFGAALSFSSDGNGTDFVISMNEGKAPA